MACCGNTGGAPRAGAFPSRATDVLRRPATEEAGPRGIRGLTAAAAARGAAEVVKVASGIDVVDSEEATRRLRICAACPEMVEDELGPVRWWSCRECGCILRFKTMSGSQHCNLEKW
jgi:hypothetical protein